MIYNWNHIVGFTFSNFIHFLYKKNGKAIFLWLIGLEVSLIAIYQQKCTFHFLKKHPEWGAFSFCIWNEWLLIFIIPLFAFSFCLAINALEYSDMKVIVNDKWEVY